MVVEQVATIWFGDKQAWTSLCPAASGRDDVLIKSPGGVQPSAPASLP